MKIPVQTRHDIANTYCSYPYSLSEMSDMYPYCMTTISKVLKEQGVPIYTKQQIHNRDAYEDYFSFVSTEEQAYLLGLFISDGCVFADSNTRSIKIALCLKEEDRYMVEYFSRAINSPNMVLRQEKYNPTTNRTNVTYQASIYSNIMAYDLDNYGACIGKWRRELPLLSPYLMRHLIRGLFDGDGSFSYRLTHPERKVCNSLRGCVDIVAYPIIMDDLIDIYTNVIGVSNYTFNRQKDTPNLMSIRLERKQDIVKFYNYIYYGANIYLHRKRDRFERFFVESNMSTIIT